MQGNGVQRGNHARCGAYRTLNAPWVRTRLDPIVRPAGMAADTDQILVNKLEETPGPPCTSITNSGVHGANAPSSPLGPGLSRRSSSASMGASRLTRTHARNGRLP